MRLYPALRVNGEVVKGKVTDSHNTIADELGFESPDESIRGFTPDGKLFLNRKQALGWLKKFDIKTFRKLPGTAHYDGLHSEHLAKAYGVEQSALAQEIREIAKEEGGNATKTVQNPSSNMVEVEGSEDQGVEVNLKDKTAIVWDRGLYLFMAEKLAETFKKVYYYMPQSEPYPCSKTKHIGTGLNVERVYEFWPYLDKVDLIVFPDCYDGEMQHWLRSKGYKVFGNGRGEKLEMDKVFFLETMEDVGLPVARTYRAEGLDDLEDYLSKHPGPAWLKTSYYRGDFETKKFTSMAQIQPWIDSLRAKLGPSSSLELELLVQDKIESEVEVGYDGFCIDGQYTGNCIAGYEVKDRGYIGAIQKDPAPIVKYVNDKISKVFADLGYRGHFSTEIRITKDGVPYFIDPTCRLPSPPSELMVEMYENYPQLVWDIAGGIVPTPEPRAKYGVDIVITSDVARELPIYVGISNDVKQWVKLKNHMKIGKDYYCIPNGNDQYVGAVVALGNTVEEAINNVKKYLKGVSIEGFDPDLEALDEAQEQINNGKKFGVSF